MEWRFVIYWIILACIEGVTQGHYQDLLYRYGHNKRFNLHPLYVVARICTLLVIWSALPYDQAQDKYTHIQCFLFCFWLCWIHPFFHNGVLYTVRNYFAPEIYKKKFFSNKEDAGTNNPNEEKAAWNEFNFLWRTTMFAIGMAAIVVLIHFE